MKRLLPLVLALLLALALCACEKAPPEPETKATEAPTQPPTEPATEPQSEAPSEERLVMPDNVPTDENGKPYYLLGHYLNRAREGVDDPYYYGEATLTHLDTGETTLNFSPRCLHYSNTDMLDWANARTDAEGLFEDARLTLTVTGPGTEETVVLHDGKDANYVYLSAEGLYVPVVNGSDRYLDLGNRPEWIDEPECPQERTEEEIASELSTILRDNWDRWLAVEPEYRVRTDAPEEAAQQYCEHLEQHLMQMQESLLGQHWRYEYIRVENLTDVVYDEQEGELFFRYDITRKAATPESDTHAGGWIVDNEDGSYTQTTEGFLRLNEDGEWENPMSLENWWE